MKNGDRIAVSENIDKIQSKAVIDLVAPFKGYILNENEANVMFDIDCNAIRVVRIVIGYQYYRYMIPIC
jgi:hypothetical protein